MRTNFFLLSSCVEISPKKLFFDMETVLEFDLLSPMFECICYMSSMHNFFEFVFALYTYCIEV